MRILDKEKVAYTAHFYEHEEGVAVDGVSVAKRLSQDPERVFKTLVLQGKSKAFYVFVIPVEKELDLKLSASAVGEKSVEMIHVKDINQITGYIRGGCSPIGMKKQFPTVIDSSAESKETITVSGGNLSTANTMSFTIKTNFDDTVSGNVKLKINIQAVVDIATNMRLYTGDNRITVRRCAEGVNAWEIMNCSEKGFTGQYISTTAPLSATAGAYNNWYIFLTPTPPSGATITPSNGYSY